MSKDHHAHALKQHSILFIATVIAIAAIGTTAKQHLKASVSSKDAGIADIAIEHNAPLGFEISMSVRSKQALIELSHDGDEVVMISLPSKWERKEVRNARLDQVKADPKMLGFVRWHFPPKSRITFTTLKAPDNILLHNPTKQPMKVKYTYIDLEDESVERNVILMKDKSVLLWE